MKFVRMQEEINATTTYVVNGPEVRKAVIKARDSSLTGLTIRAGWVESEAEIAYREDSLSLDLLKRIEKPYVITYPRQFHGSTSNIHGSEFKKILVSHLIEEIESWDKWRNPTQMPGFLHPEPYSPHRNLCRRISEIRGSRIFTQGEVLDRLLGVEGWEMDISEFEEVADAQVYLVSNDQRPGPLYIGIAPNADQEPSWFFQVNGAFLNEVKSLAQKYDFHFLETIFSGLQDSTPKEVKDWHARRWDFENQPLQDFGGDDFIEE